jgi:hypothetical protein
VRACLLRTCLRLAHRCIAFTWRALGSCLQAAISHAWLHAHLLPRGRSGTGMHLTRQVRTQAGKVLARCCRVVVILASVLVFRNPMLLETKVCTGVALAGVFAYSQVKRLRGNGGGGKKAKVATT